MEKKLGPSTESHKNWSRNLPYMSTIHAVSITTLRSAQGPRYSCFYNIKTLSAEVYVGGPLNDHLGVQDLQVVMLLLENI